MDREALRQGGEEDESEFGVQGAQGSGSAGGVSGLDFGSTFFSSFHFFILTLFLAMCIADSAFGEACYEPFHGAM